MTETSKPNQAQSSSRNQPETATRVLDQLSSPEALGEQTAAVEAKPSLAEGPSRRGFLATLIGALLAALFALSPWAPASARGRGGRRGERGKRRAERNKRRGKRRAERNKRRGKGRGRGWRGRGK